MSGSRSIASEFAVGDPARPVLGRAVLGSMLVAAVFVAFTWSAKELRGLYVHEPWQDDPYDAVVSFAIFFVPLLTGLCMLRIPLCQREAPLPVGRALDLMRASRVLIGVVLVTLLSDWISVVLQAHHGMWTGATAAVLGVLVLVTALAVAVARELRRASGVPLANTRALDMPDWLADAVAIGGRTAAGLGPFRPIAVASVRLMDRRLVPAIRRYPLGAAAILSAAFGIAAAIPQAVEEGYVLSGLVLFISVAAGGMFAFLVTVGAYLRLAGTAHRPRGRLVHPLVAACASLPITIAFRDALWSLLSVNGRHAGATGLEVLLLLIAITTGVIAFAAEPLLPRHSESREI